MNTTPFIFLVFLTACLLTAGILVGWRQRIRGNASAEQVQILGAYSPVLTWLKRSPALLRRPITIKPFPLAVPTAWRQRWKTLAEMAVIVIWALWVGRVYLNLDSHTWVDGVDYPTAAPIYLQWKLLPQCGACVFWNGSLNGGYPAAVDLLTAHLQPVMLVLLGLFGVINAAKLAVVIALIIAGLAQWWLAKVMRLGMVSRLWAGGMAVVGGHLAGRLDVGGVETVFSAAFGALVIPMALTLVLTGSRRAAIGLSLTVAVMLLSGQGYSQVGLVAGIVPALFVFLLKARPDGNGLMLRPIWREFGLAAAVCILLAAVLWVPVVHFGSNLRKFAEPTFKFSQPLQYLPLNLVIDDIDFHRSSDLSKDPAPGTNADYFGWIPVVLAVVGGVALYRADKQLAAFFFIGLVLLALWSSATLQKWLLPVFPSLASIRYTPVIMVMFGPLLLGLAAVGLETVLLHAWPALWFEAGNQRFLGVSLLWVIAPVLVLFSLKSAYDFNQNWLRVRAVNTTESYPALTALRRGEAEWVEMAVDDRFGLSENVLVAFDLGLKVTHLEGQRGFGNRDMPPPAKTVGFGSLDKGANPTAYYLQSMYVVEHPDTSYASVMTSDQRFSCSASAEGGDIDVTCQNKVPGQLVVYENKWDGWTVQRDGVAQPLLGGQWLSVEAPAGLHHYAFRYRPWDVWLGLALTLAGLSLSGWWLVWGRPEPKVSQTSP